MPRRGREGPHDNVSLKLPESSSVKYVASILWLHELDVLQSHHSFVSKRTRQCHARFLDTNLQPQHLRHQTLQFLLHIIARRCSGRGGSRGQGSNHSGFR
jgi:hypothetical protein